MAQRGIVAAGGWGMSWTATPRLAPDVQPWLARVFDVRERTPNVVGAGFLVDEQHVVTCAHVVLAALGAGERDPLPPGEVGVPLDFPAADGEPVWATVDRDAWRPVDADGRGDVAVLQLSSPLPAIEPAPLRAPTALRDHTFSTHGFPPGEPWGVTAVGVLRGREGPGWQWVRVENTGFVGRPVERGFSGAPVWDDQLGAVVGMVVAQDRRREARGAYAIPVAVLAQAWPLATLAVPGSNAEELEKHWAPRSRGVKSLTPTTGWYFTGRRQALRELVGWLTAPSDEQPRGRVVSGGPGSGKSAVLARLVTLSDPRYRRRVPLAGVDPEDVPPAGSVTVAVWAEGKSLDQVVAAIGDALDCPAADPESLVAALVMRGRPFSLVLDGLDEASGGGSDIARRLLRPLASEGSSIGVRVLVGTRRPLLAKLGTAAFDVIDLDQPPYLAMEDLVEYAARRLMLDTEPTAPTPYRGRPELAREVATAIAARAYPTFLVAQLFSQALAQDSEPVDITRPGWADRFPATVDDAMDDYLGRLGAEEGRARDLLRPLAYAEGDGLAQGELWADLANVLSRRTEYTVNDIAWLLGGPAAYLVQAHSSTRHPGGDPERGLTDDGDPLYRLWHQAFRQHMRPAEDESRQQRRIVELLLASVSGPVGERDWNRIGPYGRRYLATHAAAAARLDELLCADNAGFLLIAEPAGVLRALPALTSQDGRRVGAVYRLCAHVLRHCPAGLRASHLELEARRRGLDQLARRIADAAPDRPWRTSWACPRRSVSTHQVVGRHNGPVFAVTVAALTDGTPVAVSGGDDDTVRVWRLSDGAPVGGPRHSHDGVLAIVATQLADGTPVTVSFGNRVRIEQLVDGVPIATTDYPGVLVQAAVAGALSDGTPVAISGDDDGTVRVWRLADACLVGETRCHEDALEVVALAAGTLADRSAVLVTVFRDGTVRVEHPPGDLSADPSSPESAPELNQDDEDARFVSEAWLGTLSDGTEIGLAEGVENTVLRLADGTRLELPVNYRLADGSGEAAGVLGDGTLVAVVKGPQGSGWLWRLRPPVPDGEPLPVPGRVLAVGALADGTPVAVSAESRLRSRLGPSERLQVHRLPEGSPIGDQLVGHDGAVNAVALGVLPHPAGTGANRDPVDVVVTGSDDGTVRMWPLPVRRETGLEHDDADGSRVEAVALAELRGVPVAVAGGRDGVQVRRLDDGAMLSSWLEAAPPAPATSKEYLDRLLGLSRAPIAVGALDKDTPVAVTGGQDETLRVRRLQDASRVCEVHGHSPLAVGALDDGTPVAVSGDGAGDGLRVWRLADGETVCAAPGCHSPLAVGALDDGTPVAVSGDGDGLRVWRLADGSPVGPPLLDRDDCADKKRDFLMKLLGLDKPPRLSCLAVTSLDMGTVVVSGQENGTVRMWTLAHDRAHGGAPILGHDGAVRRVAVATLADGTSVSVTGGQDGTLRMWRMADGAPLGRPLQLAGAVDLLVCQPGASVVAAGDFGIAALQPGPVHR